MSTRLVAILLALLLSWSGFATQEPPHRTAPPDIDTSIGSWSGNDAPRGVGGSVDEHHLDDLPAQAQAENAADLPDPLELDDPVALSARPSPPVACAPLARPPPDLAVPQRPPCCTPLRA